MSGRYLWLAWPLTGVLATLLAVAESRGNRAAVTQHDPGGFASAPQSGGLLDDSATEEPGSQPDLSR